MSTQSRIETKLGELKPQFLRVENESARHNVPPGSESHFKVTIVSPRFGGLKPLARHRMVHEILATELAGSVHALALRTMTPEEWGAGDGVIADSPPCLGGSAAERK